MTCTGTTANGSRCQHHATPGYDTCAAHRRQGHHRDTVLAADLAPDGAITSHQENPPRSSSMTDYLGAGAPSQREPGSLGAPGIDLRRPAPEARANRMHSPAPPINDTQARELLARMKHDGLITQTRDGQYHLRSYGRDVLTALKTITQEGN